MINFFKRYYLRIILFTFFIVLGSLGYWGFSEIEKRESASTTTKQADNTYSFGFSWTLLYRTLQLTTGESGDVDGDVPLQLNIARFLLPVVSIITVIEVFFGHVLAWIPRATRRFIRPLIPGINKKNVVICGLGQKGLALAINFKVREYNVVVVEQDKNNVFIEDCKTYGISIVPGNAMNEDVLKDAGIDSAQYLVTVCGNDNINTQVATIAKKITGNRQDITFLIHNSYPNLAFLRDKYVLRARTEQQLQTRIFNIFDIGARLLLQQAGIFDTENSSSNPHLLVVSLEDFGEAVITQAVRQRKLKFANTRVPLRITVLDQNCAEKVQSLQNRYPGLLSEDNCTLKDIDVDVRSTEIFQGNWFPIPNYPITIACICLSDESLGFHTAYLLFQKQPHIPIYVFMDEEFESSVLLQASETQKRRFLQTVREINVFKRACTPEMLLGTYYEVLAIALYGQVHWDRLSIEKRDFYREKVDTLISVLKEEQYSIVSLRDWEQDDMEPIKNNRLEELALRWYEKGKSSSDTEWKQADYNSRMQRLPSILLRSGLRLEKQK